MRQHKVVSDPASRLHGLYQDPSRLWKRYLINNCDFVAKLALQFSRLR
jgi:UDP-N-acetyl-D-mannosaminuronic acid transferase (WecB/TagA/CpsF family)